MTLMAFEPRFFRRAIWTAFRGERENQSDREAREKGYSFNLLSLVTCLALRALKAASSTICSNIITI